MIPAHLITIEEFPLNASGKINRAALPPPQPRPASEYAAPATPLEISLAGMYAAVLGRDRVGATDSFFDLGGSSLQVMRLIDLISKELGTDVGAPAVFLQPTPRQLAASIAAAGSQDAGPADPASLVPLTSGPGELPLFLIHAVGGTVFAYAQLARQLAATFRVYGLQAPGLSQEGATAASLAALADDYSRRIRAAQPGGPYRLAGWSMGGVIAFEIARRLEGAGQEVSLLALLDAPFAISGNGPASSAELAGQFVADATRSLGWDAAAAPPDPATTTAAAQLDWLAARMSADDEHGADGAGRDGDAHQAATAAQLRRRFEIFSAHVRMLAGYRPQAAAVRAPALIVSADHSPNAP
jgi:thioesterase domain-containing protein